MLAVVAVSGVICFATGTELSEVAKFSKETDLLVVFSELEFIKLPKFIAFEE